MLVPPLPGKLTDDWNNIILNQAGAKWDDFKDVVRINALVLARFDLDEGRELNHVVLVGQIPDATTTEKGTAAAFANFIAASLQELGYLDVPVYVIAWNAHDMTNGTPLESDTTIQTKTLTNVTKQFTDASGVSTALTKMETMEGTRGFWLCKTGDPTGRYAVSCRHVWQVDHIINQEENLPYNYMIGPGLSRAEVAWPVDMPGIKQMVDQKRRDLGRLIRAVEHRIARPNRTANAWDVLAKEESEHALNELIQFEAKTVRRKEDLKTRTSGYVEWSPPIDLDPQTGCAIDMAIARSYESAHSPDELENYIILGDKISEIELLNGLNSNDANTNGFIYPDNGKLVFKTSITPMAMLMKGTQVNEEGKEDTPVLKDGRTTGITMGRVSSAWGERDITMPDGSKKRTRELVIFNLKKTEAFSQKGDSGSAIVRCVGERAELVGMVTGGRGENCNPDITWATPAEVLQQQWAAQGYYLPGTG
ncbi:hypothetical protein DV738_g392, partial [Chaetothyriales sp. CBS 135597]